MACILALLFGFAWQHPLVDNIWLAPARLTLFFEAGPFYT